jgi:hypothetical protein
MEQRRLDEIHQMFNIAEKPVMEFISDFLEEPPAIIFKDDIPSIAMPLILKPINEYNENYYIKFELIISDDNDEINVNRINKVNEMLVYNEIKESIGFLLFCLNHVFVAIKSSGMIANSKLLNIDLGLNPETWGFHGEYKHDLTIKKEFYEMNIKKLENADNESEQKINECINLLNEINISDEIINIEKDINTNLKNKKFIAINIVDIDKSTLPKSSQ